MLKMRSKRGDAFGFSLRGMAVTASFAAPVAIDGSRLNRRIDEAFRSRKDRESEAQKCALDAEPRPVESMS